MITIFVDNLGMFCTIKILLFFLREIESACTILNSELKKNARSEAIARLSKSFYKIRVFLSFGLKQNKTNKQKNLII